MASTVGAFILGVGILLSIINVIWSLQQGALAGKNPWNADSLEWSTDSPPAPYAFVHIPTVRSRHPLWDDYDEEFDPGDQRVYDQGRLTIASSLLDAEPVALGKMPEDSFAPLLLTIALVIFFSGALAENLWIVLIGALAVIPAMGYWLWPQHERVVA